MRYGLAPLQARQGTCPLRMVWMGGWAPTNGGVSSTGAADGSYRLLDSGDWSWVDMCSVYSEGLWMCTVHDQCRSLGLV